MEQLEPFLSYALALFSGLLIGLEREHSRAQAGSHSRFLGGVRTFPLFALAAAVSASLVPALGPWPYGPYGVFNPWKLGVSVTLIAGVSFVGYAASRVMGSGRGLLVTGLVGGLVSSTAVTLASVRHHDSVACRAP